MDHHKRAAEEERSTTPESSPAPAALVTPQKKFRTERSEPNSSPSAAAKNKSELESKAKDNDNVADDDDEEDRKPAAQEELVVAEENDDVHHEDASEEDDTAVNAETVMGFERFPTSSNKTIMLEHYDFVRWARARKDPYGRLEAFVAWSNTDGAKVLEMQGRGRETFTFGQHSGETFAEVAENDSEYHKRYMRALNAKAETPPEVLTRYMEYLKLSKKSRRAVGGKKKKQPVSSSTPPRKKRSTTRRTGSNAAANEVFPFGQHRGQTFWQVAEEDPSYHLRYKDMDDSPNPVLDRYIEWFVRYAPTRFVAHQAHRDDFAAAIGIIPDCWHNYDSDDEPYW